MNTLQVEYKAKHRQRVLINNPLSKTGKVEWATVYSVRCSISPNEKEVKRVSVSYSGILDRTNAKKQPLRVHFGDESIIEIGEVIPDAFAI